MDACRFNQDGKHREFLLPGPFPRGGKKKCCQDCLRFLGWEGGEKNASGEAPKQLYTVQAEDKDKIFILQSGDLNSYEEEFLKSIARRDQWSAKQKNYFDLICKNYLTPKEESTNDDPF